MEQTINIIIKTKTNQRHILTIYASNTISEIKQKIYDELAIGIPESQKLIHRGKLLTKNYETAEMIGFKQKDILIVLTKNIKKKSTRMNMTKYIKSQPKKPKNKYSESDSEIYLQGLSLVVFGYIRSAQNYWNLIIPFDITAICYNYLKPEEYFECIDNNNNKNNKSMISFNNKIITNHSSQYYTIYGKICIDPTYNTSYFWKFKIISCQVIYIGIDEINIEREEKIKREKGSRHRKALNYIINEYNNKPIKGPNKISYSYCSSGDIYRNQQQCKKFDVFGYNDNDIVCMKLNCYFNQSNDKYVTLSFGKDKNLLTKAFINVIRDKKYRMAVSFRGSSFGKKSSDVQLLEFNEGEIINY